MTSIIEAKTRRPQSRKSSKSSRRIVLTGHVQGVGFRPFVFRLAKQYQLNGWVQNQLGQVAVEVVGDNKNVQRFVSDLIQQAPPLSKPKLQMNQKRAVQNFETFEILASSQSSAPQIFVPPDYFMCAACQAELSDANDRRYRYPFINCTQCGPRYTLIRSLPYDRVNTTMVDFVLCNDCRQEYLDPCDRRFHAEPIACAKCGPHLTFADNDGCIIDTTQAAIEATVKLLKLGRIIALKGIGGYHLMCDAKNELAVKRLRIRKHRPDKPLAVLFPTGQSEQLTELKQYVELSQSMQRFLLSPMRPIVLAKKKIFATTKPNTPLASAIAPGLDQIGVFLGYSPLHHLVLNDFGGPLVATSGNLSGEPVITDNQQASSRLSSIADAFLHHNRPIQRPADDPVFRFINQKPQAIRLGRGCAPQELNIPWRLEHPVLAVGGQLKNTVALGWQNRLVISPHIGEMDTPRSLNVFEQVISDLQSLYGQTAKILLCDAHPGYTTQRWALQQGLSVHKIQHHHAHASALYADQQNQATLSQQKSLTFTWDGAGYALDGSLWGGETLFGSPGNWQRVASMGTFKLVGGDKVSRQPWRSAAALCWQSGFPWSPQLSQISCQQVALLRHAWQKDLNCSQSSAVGRIFDAASSLLLGLEKTSFEGQGPMQLEAIAEQVDFKKESAIELPMTADKQNILRVDWSPLLSMLSDQQQSARQRSASFHHSLANNILHQAKYFREQTGVNYIGLTGGVFQNKLLSELSVFLLHENGFETFLANQLPVNDGCLSFGQIAEYASALWLKKQRQTRHELLD